MPSKAKKGPQGSDKAVGPARQTTATPTSKPTQPVQLPSPTWLKNVSKANLALILLLYVALLHITGLYIFTKGFLLSRTAIPTTSPAYTLENPPIIPPTHKKAVILIIDALRTDFISPHHPTPRSIYHHDILTLPQELASADPTRSLIFNSYSDPPTSTMQRIKGITTGSLPTFIDIGSNFASTAIEEDSIVSQLVAHNKSVVCMGDDTWVNLFPNSFTYQHPFDSFNVEDLHTVDNGVISHLFPYLQPENATKWDVLIGHFLGVDHVGHRVGPERDTMQTKLKQMDDVLRAVVEMLDEETLLVVLGDHGMDSKGNHGGDSELEVAAAMWIYSKGPQLAPKPDNLPESLPTYTYPGSSVPIRNINQIDLVPTLSLLLGVPIPFNNLGSVIPECFALHHSTLELATKSNAEQIMRYIKDYGDPAIEAGLYARWNKASAAADLVDQVEPDVPKETATERMSKWLRTGHTSDDPVVDAKISEAQRYSISSNRDFALAALDKLRSLWAQFSVPLILIGLTLFGLSVPTLIALYRSVRNNGVNWDLYVRLALETAALPSLGLASLAGAITAVQTKDIGSTLLAGLSAALFASEIILILPVLLAAKLPRISDLPITRTIGPIILVLHALSFGSNSFIMWEDRMVLFLINTIPLIHLIKALTAPTAAMRIKIILLSAGFMVINRVAALVTVCREEQQPYCRVTFYSGTTASAPNWALAITIVVGSTLPRLIGFILDSSKSNAGPAPAFLNRTMRYTLIANASYWGFEWLETWHGLQPARIPLVQLIRLWVARASLVTTCAVMLYQLIASPLCIKIEKPTDQTGEEGTVTVLGFANAYGSTYLLLLLVPFAQVHLVSQPMAQLVLSGLFLGILANVETTDTQRDAIIMSRSFSSSSNPGAFEPTQTTTIVRPTFTDIVPLALLGFLGFFSTGHQAVLTSIQWKSAFIGFPSLTYPFSPLLVILNTWGAFFLSALAVPLLALWNVSPRPQGSIPVLTHSLQLSLGMMIYHSTITLASAVGTAWLRRHLMVWKVFAPRFMLAGVTVLIVDLGLILAVGLGVRFTSWKVWRTFKCVSV